MNSTISFFVLFKQCISVIIFFSITLLLACTSKVSEGRKPLGETFEKAKIVKVKDAVVLIKHTKYKNPAANYLIPARMKTELIKDTLYISVDKTMPDLHEFMPLFVDDLQLLEVSGKGSVSLDNNGFANTKTACSEIASLNITKAGECSITLEQESKASVFGAEKLSLLMDGLTELRIDSVKSVELTGEIKRDARITINGAYKKDNLKISGQAKLFKAE